MHGMGPIFAFVCVFLLLYMVCEIPFNVDGSNKITAKVHVVCVGVCVASDICHYNFYVHVVLFCFVLFCFFLFVFFVLACEIPFNIDDFKKIRRRVCVRI